MKQKTVWFAVFRDDMDGKLRHISEDGDTICTWPTKARAQKVLKQHWATKAGILRLCSVKIDAWKPARAR